MIETLLQELRDLDFDALTSREAVQVRQLINDAVAKWDAWIARIAQAVNNPDGRPPEKVLRKESPQPVKPPEDRRTPVKRRGRPPKQVVLNKPAPLAVGGADSGGAEPQPAQIFQESYVSKDGPRPGSALPPDHPRRNLNRESSVTPEVDMSDFQEAEEAARKGQLGKMFQ